MLFLKFGSHSWYEMKGNALSSSYQFFCPEIGHAPSLPHISSGSLQHWQPALEKWEGRMWDEPQVEQWGSKILVPASYTMALNQ